MCLNRFLIKGFLSSSLCNNNHSLHYLKNSIKCIHSLHHSKPIKQLPKNPKNQIKSSSNNKHIQDQPKDYMRNTVSKIYTILKYSSWDTAQDQLSRLDIKWDSYTVNQVLKTHPPMEKAWIFFNWASRLKGFKHDHFTYTTMLDIFGEAGRIESMQFLFKQMREKRLKIDAFTYTSVMNWVSKYGNVNEAIKIWEEMRENGCDPTVVSYTAYMKVLFDNGRVKEGIDVYKEMLESGISPNCHTYTVLMEYLVVNCKYQEALEIFRNMQEAGVQPDKAACNILVERCCKASETRMMTQILQYMKENHLVLRYPIFLEAFKTLEVAGESDALLRQVNPHCASESISNKDAFEFMATADDDPLDGRLVLILLKKQNLVAVDRLLAGIMDRNILLDSWIVSTIIEVNCNHCRLDGALLAFEYSMKVGMELNREAYLALIGLLIRSKSFMKVMGIVKVMNRAGHSLGIYLGALLIYRLGCARRLTCAANLFNLLPDNQKCTATYTALISVNFFAGRPEKGLKIYETMKKRGIHASLGTYNVLLAGLERSGRVCETETYRKEKKSLLIGGYGQNGVPVEEKICDLLFAGDIIS